MPLASRLWSAGGSCAISAAGSGSTTSGDWPSFRPVRLVSATDYSAMAGACAVLSQVNVIASQQVSRDQVVEAAWAAIPRPAAQLQTQELQQRLAAALP